MQLHKENSFLLEPCVLWKHCRLSLCTLIRASITLYGPSLFMCLPIFLNCQLFEGSDHMRFSSASLVLYLEQILAYRCFGFAWINDIIQGTLNIDKEGHGVWFRSCFLDFEETLTLSNVWTGWYWVSRMMVSPVFPCVAPEKWE